MIRLVLVVLPLGLLVAQQTSDSFNYREADVPGYELPDPLVTEEGQRVTTADAWRLQRRPEIVELFEKHVYGMVPKNVPDRVKFEVVEASVLSLGEKARRTQVRATIGDAPETLAVDILLYLPADTNAPVPVFLGLNFYGNHTVRSDPEIRLATSWISGGRRYGIVNNRATDRARGLRASQWPVEMILSRGYGLVTAYSGDIDPDFDDGFKNGVHALTGRPGPEEWGTISAWAWGLSRTLDYLENDPAVDASRVAVMGHSRLGKAALWAGALDQRFAMVISNESGCGGAALSRCAFGETVESINSTFPHWFATAFSTYSSNESSLPVDQHQLIALVAPRPVYIASAERDAWADPMGEFLAAVHAGPVYELLGKRGLETNERPQPESYIHNDIGYHMRPGAHDVTSDDWSLWMDFADKHFFANESSANEPSGRLP